MQLIDDKDPQLWRMAQKRAQFKKHLTTYIIINGFFWVIWFIGDFMQFGNEHYGSSYPWPIWPMLGWGIGLAFNYFEAYHGDKNTLADREYEKLKQEQDRKNL